MNNYDAWVFRRLLAGKSRPEDLAAISASWKLLADLLDRLPERERGAAWQGHVLTRANREALIQAVDAQDPSAPAPEGQTGRRIATLADLAASEGDGRFVWPGYLVKAHCNVLSSDPKIGKTHLALDLAKRIYFGQPWPDGQPPTFPEGTKTLWVCGDRHQIELWDRATAFGLPPEAVMLNADSDNPYGGRDLDEEESIKGLRERVIEYRPALVIIDTVWRATKRRLHETTEVNAVLDPLLEIAQECDVALLGLMHLSLGNESLGRRIEGFTRSILKLTRPDPAQKKRLRLEVSGNFKEGEALGVTLHDKGCDYDDTPPKKAETGSREAPKTDAGFTFFEDTLTCGDRTSADLLKEWEATGGKPGVFWDVRKALINQGKVVADPFDKKVLHWVTTVNAANPTSFGVTQNF
jgi:hypothetical protein